MIWDEEGFIGIPWEKSEGQQIGGQNDVEGGSLFGGRNVLFKGGGYI